MRAVGVVVLLCLGATAVVGLGAMGSPGEFHSWVDGTQVMRGLQATEVSWWGMG